MPILQSFLNSPLITDGPPPKQLGTVLIIEDDEELADLFQDWILSFYGQKATVKISTSVDDAETSLESLHALDVVLIDRKLPDGKGEDIVSTIQSKFDTITVLVTGALPDTDIIQLAVNDYLLKPIDEETFIKRLSLLENLHTAGALESYSEARKASLLAYHLEDPDDDPLYRRFANRWSYDRLELAHVGEKSFVYGLYFGGGTERDVSVSVLGSLGPDVDDSLEDGEIARIGELVPTEDGYAWIGAIGRIRSTRIPTRSVSTSSPAMRPSNTSPT